MSKQKQQKWLNVLPFCVLCSSGTRSRGASSISLDITKTLVLTDWWPTLRPTASHGTSLHPRCLIFLFLEPPVLILWKPTNWRLKRFMEQQHSTSERGDQTTCHWSFIFLCTRVQRGFSLSHLLIFFCCIFHSLFISPLLNDMLLKKIMFVISGTILPVRQMLNFSFFSFFFWFRVVHFIRAVVFFCFFFAFLFQIVNISLFFFFFFA